MLKIKGYKTILQDREYCFGCGQRYQEYDVHHVFNKYNKKKSEQYGMMVLLCRECHKKVHDTDLPCRRELESFAQESWERCYGTREDFIKEFNKNYAL